MARKIPRCALFVRENEQKKARDRSRAKCSLSTYRLRTVNVGAMLVESALQEAERLDDHHDEPGHEHEEVFDRLFESFDILS